MKTSPPSQTQIPVGGGEEITEIQLIEDSRRNSERVEITAKGAAAKELSVNKESMN